MFLCRKQKVLCSKICKLLSQAVFLYKLSTQVWCQKVKANLSYYVSMNFLCLSYSDIGLVHRYLGRNPKLHFGITYQNTEFMSMGLSKLKFTYKVPTKSLETICHFPIPFNFNTLSYQILLLLCMFKQLNLTECSIARNNYF